MGIGPDVGRIVRRATAKTASVKAAKGKAPSPAIAAYIGPKATARATTKAQAAPNVTAAIARIQKAYASSPKASGVPAGIAALDVKFGKKYGIPPSVLASQQRQESGFNPGAVSSAGAFGVSQFMPATASGYGVKQGTDRAAVKTQVKGQAQLLTDKNFKQDPQGALTAYSGGYSAGAYNNPVLAGAKDFKGLDKPGQKANPQDLKTAARAGVATPGGGQQLPARAVAPQQVSKLKAIQQAAHKLGGAGIPYVWGGGHGGFSNPKSGLDCSGAVSAVLHAAGVLNTPLTSGAMGQVLKPGPGAVTVYYNAGHTFMKIGNKYWGTSVGDSGSGGLGQHPAPSGSYLSGYSVGHVPGLGKDVAKSLGIKLAGGGSGGGGGFTASFSSGTHQTAPGFSDKPILPDNFKGRVQKLQKSLAHNVGAYYADTTSSGRVAKAQPQVFTGGTSRKVTGL